MSSGSRSVHFQLAQRLVKSLAPTRVIPLSSVRVLESPGDFHQHLCQSIDSAKRRISLASLYIGTGSKLEEDLLLQSLRQCKSKPFPTRILMDANRGTRPVGSPPMQTCAAKAVQETLQDKVHLFQTLRQPLSLLPTPLNESVGVFHLKAYVTDDSTMLSGANLSQEYFTDRQDRYIVFDHERELSDFYQELVEIMSQYAQTYPCKGTPSRKNDLSDMTEALSRIFQPCNSNFEDDPSVVAYAIPTFAHPGVLLPFSTDSQQLASLLSTTAREGLTLRLASAYLNPTPPFLKLLQAHSDCTLLTAGAQSHGFAPKPGVKRTGDFVPMFFEHQAQQLAQSFQLLQYNRPGWTFHAKGLWILSSDGNLVAAVVGSGNYGYRSERRDVESNLILVFPNETSRVQDELLDEWERLCQFAEEPMFREPSPHHVRILWPWIQSFF